MQDGLAAVPTQSRSNQISKKNEQKQVSKGRRPTWVNEAIWNHCTAAHCGCWSHRPLLHAEDVPTNTKGWSCAVLAQMTAEAQRCKEVLQDNPLQFSQRRNDLVCVNGHASMCGVGEGVSMYMFTYVLRKETKMPQDMVGMCSSEEGNRENPLAGERQDHTHTGQLQGKMLIQSHSRDPGYGAASDGSLIRTNIVAELTCHGIHPIFAEKNTWKKSNMYFWLTLAR